MSTLQRHELGESYPDISSETASPIHRASFKALKASIAEGFLKDKPIVMYEGCVLDGWARYQAALAVGVEPCFVEPPLEGTNAAIEHLVAAHTRRSMTRSQLVMTELYRAWSEGKLKSREDTRKLEVELAEKWECSEQLVGDQLREFGKWLVYHREEVVGQEYP